MASLLLRPLLRPQALGLGLGLSLTTYHAVYRQQAIRLDSSPSSSGSILSGDSYRKNAQVPVIRNGGLNERAVRQISSGSIVGLCAGLVVSTFSRPLAIVLGLLIVGVQYASSQLGINIIPYNRLQRYVTSIDLRSAVQDNVAFKLSFGTTFALAAFMKF
ncbi:uncharacterized protein LY89DRAFT_641054 [Mollisia scopiformis]|uniref:Fun14 family protein n=1 Tax=Mollisia scopiformis TaxID=149040 RepID=A0A194XHU9_MOLSC|nr:uncharacterized protein LY89DRAFT_641054 [Mollisia scopiformis]KUJ19795.1 hypothetical protein LY89DRAFT_641054 [Mollisia scopiformis]